MKKLKLDNIRVTSFITDTQAIKGGKFSAVIGGSGSVLGTIPQVCKTTTPPQFTDETCKRFNTEEC